MQREGHTPGPWKIDDRGISARGYLDVARAREGWVYNERDSEPATIEFANEADRLVAQAAPDLFKTLEEAFRVISQAAETGFYVGEGIFDKMNAALTRAREGSNNEG